MSKAEENGSNGAASDGVLHVAFVLDKSGSMGSIEEAVVSGYNDYLGELRAQGGETLYSLTTFDTTFDHVCVGEPLDRVPELDHRLYRPGGMTALYDAIAHTVLETDGRLQAAGRGDEKVLVVVMTDGLENSSTDYDAARDRGTRARATTSGRTGRSSTSEPATRTSPTRSTPPRGWAIGTRTRCSGRPTPSPPASPCARSRTQPGRGACRCSSRASASSRTPARISPTTARTSRRRLHGSAQSPPRPRRPGRPAAIHRLDLGDALATSKRPSKSGDQPSQEPTAGPADR